DRAGGGQRRVGRDTQERLHARVVRLDFFQKGRRQFGRTDFTALKPVEKRGGSLVDERHGVGGLRWRKKTRVAVVYRKQPRTGIGGRSAGRQGMSAELDPAAPRRRKRRRAGGYSPSTAGTR